MEVLNGPGLAMMDILLQPDWHPGGPIPDGGSRETSKTMRYHGSGSLDGFSDGRSVCVYIYGSFLCCVRLVVPTFGVRIVGNKQYSQGSALDLWTMCSFGLDALRILLGNPVAVKGVENIGNIMLWYCWLSC